MKCITKMANEYLKNKRTKPMTAEQLEELLGRVTPPDKDDDWVPAVDCDGAYESIWDAKLSLMTYSIARRVLAAEKLVEALCEVPLGDGIIGQLVTAYREASK